MDDPGTHSPDPDPQPVGIPGPAPAPTAAPTAEKKPFLAMSWPRRRRIGAALAVVALATTGGVAIAATSGSPSPSPAPDGYAAPGSPQEQKQMLEKKMMADKGLAVRGMKGAFGLGMGGVLHGEFVAADGNGGYVTHLMQTGTVTSVGDSSLGVKSDDGYTHDYVLNGDTVVNGARGWTAESKGGVATGQKVTVMATKSGDTTTATMIGARDEKADKVRMEMPGGGMMKRFELHGGPSAMMPGGLMGEGEVRRFDMAVPGDKMTAPAPDQRMMPGGPMGEDGVRPAAPAAPEAPDDVAAPTPSAGT